MEVKKIEILKSNLELYNMDYKTDNNDIIKVNHLPFEFNIKFQDKRILMSSKLKGWNFVTDFIDISFEKALNYLLIKQLILIILSVILFYFNKINYSFSSIFLITGAICFFMIFQYIYYIDYRIKHDSFKNTLMEWLSK